MDRFAAFVLASLLSLTWAQNECPVITESELGSRDALSASGLVAERLQSSQSDPPEVRIFDYNIVCFAAGSARGTYRVLSVVVHYQCSGAFCAGSPLGVEGNGTSQFEFSCSSGSWANEVEGSGTASSTFTNPSNATVDTQARRDCSFCLNNVAASGTFSPALIIDGVTHCADCSGSCLEPPQGLGFCTSQLSTTCCNFYASDVCSISCPNNISDTSFNCRVQCSTLNDPLNGTVRTTADRFDGSAANYSCNTGFSLQGPSSRTCQDNGTWSSPAPTCVTVYCGNLSEPVNGQVTFSQGKIYQSVATYSCNSGYTLSGGTQQMCLDSGVWSDSAPSCNKADCGNLSGPENGQVTISPGTAYQSVATYRCNRGYTLSGGTQRTCLDSGVWSESTPSCNKESGGLSGGAIAGIVIGAVAAVVIAVAVTAGIVFLVLRKK